VAVQMPVSVGSRPRSIRFVYLTSIVGSAVRFVNLTVMTPPALCRYRAERLLRKELPRLRSKVLAIVRSQLRAKGVELDLADLEAC
jgi:hypothetical protein